MRLDRARRVEAGQHAAGGVVDHADQDHRPRRGPPASRGSRRPSAPTRRSRRGAAGGCGAGRGGVAAATGPRRSASGAAVCGPTYQALLGQLLAGEGGAEVGVALAVGAQDRLAELGVGRWLEGWPRRPWTRAASPPASSLRWRRRTWRVVRSSRRAASAWVRSPCRTACRILRTIAFLLAHGDPVCCVGTSIDMAPPWPGQGGHFYRVKTGHFYCRSTGADRSSKAKPNCPRRGGPPCAAVVWVSGPPDR